MEKIYVITRDNVAVCAWERKELAMQAVALFNKDEELKKYKYTIQEVTLWK